MFLDQICQTHSPWAGSSPWSHFLHPIGIPEGPGIWGQGEREVRPATEFMDTQLHWGWPLEQGSKQQMCQHSATRPTIIYPAATGCPAAIGSEPESHSQSPAWEGVWHPYPGCLTSLVISMITDCYVGLFKFFCFTYAVDLILS